MPIGSSLIGRASDSESGGYRFESCLPRIILLVDIDAGMVELVDTLGLEPSALRCAGSSPVPGNLIFSDACLKLISLSAD